MGEVSDVGIPYHAEVDDDSMQPPPSITNNYRKASYAPSPNEQTEFSATGMPMPLTFSTIDSRKRVTIVSPHPMQDQPLPPVPFPGEEDDEDCWCEKCCAPCPCLFMCMCAWADLFRRKYKLLLALLGVLVIVIALGLLIHWSGNRTIVKSQPFVATSNIPNLQTAAPRNSVNTANPNFIGGRNSSAQNDSQQESSSHSTSAAKTSTEEETTESTTTTTSSTTTTSIAAITSIELDRSALLLRCPADAGGFVCADGFKVLNAKQRCDSFNDCDDASDELDCRDCESSINCPLESGAVRCLRGAVLCDGPQADCSNSVLDSLLFCDRPCLDSVEYTCAGAGGTNQRVCIIRQWLCDGDTQCPLGDDEINCQQQLCQPNTFWCESTGVCLPHWQICDGHVNCPGQVTDEDDCDCSTCHGSTLWLCNLPEGRCLHESRVCDGVVDCADAGDEFGCGV